ncbi:class I adenylate-forming enzyme family protein [Streptomyces acidicola]|uniref:AMP-binding protein n=1 Tax=Streptomyces acidicola TaxID=2596892 RepID=A0A5N8WJ68_9ACTN|nr:AMP-binding protein [Streptomyces acidicola]MPY47490.1 AMP-binding protein [Streptomyces acidicola]
MTTISPPHDRRAALEARHPRWIPRTTAQQLDAATEEFGDRPLLLADDRSHSYAEVREWTLRLAAGLLALGVRAGDHVAVDMANFPEAVALKYAVARIGAVSVSVNFLLRHEELRYVLNQSDTVVLITMDAFRGIDYLDALDRIAPDWERHAGGTELPCLRHVFVRGTGGPPSRGRTLEELVGLGQSVSDEEVFERTAAADPFAPSDLLYTSGTTGVAKGALLQHDAVLRTAYASAYTRAFQDGRRILFALPIYHVFGYVEAMVPVLFVGGAICPQPVFDADRMLHDIGRHHIDELICVPAMTSVVLATARAGQHDLSSLTTMFSSGAAHAPGIWSEMLEVLGVEELFTAYGQTETTASTLCTRPGDPIERLVSTNGCPKPAGVAGDPGLGGLLAVYRAVDPATGTEVPAGEVGELLVRGPAVTSGYYDKPDETAAAFDADGWLRTGDLGRFDEHGYLTLTGRRKDTYRCGGELVVPGEVEAVLEEHPGVRAAYVVGIPHERMGEAGCAWIVAEESGWPSPEELVAYCAERLAKFKVPAVVLFTQASDVPVTVTGRVQKFRLAERATAELGLAPVGTPA